MTGKIQKEFNLSEKKLVGVDVTTDDGMKTYPCEPYLYFKNMKEFIRLLKEGCTFCGSNIIPYHTKRKHSLCNKCFNNMHDGDSLQIKESLNNKIDKLAGEELVK
tara:strand:+ start:190 stop:504 length:315 start_codon:yes stop_codon:yes gene_type:complete